MACSSRCTTGPHETYGACLRAKGMQVADPAAHQRNQGLNKQLDNYADARRAGLQPRSVYKKDVDQAWAITEAIGTPYRADA